MRRHSPLLVIALLASGCMHEPQIESDLLIDPNPALDLELSPYTGWTRAHHVAVFARTLSGFVDHLSEGGARTTFSGSALDSPEAVEGVTRMLQGIGYWLANPDNPQRIAYHGRTLDLVEIARTALVRGTDPAHADYWLPITFGNQRVIEAGMVGQFLLDARERVWDTLTPKQQDQVMAWLVPSDELYPDNWTSAALHRNLARKRLGYPIDDAAFAAQLDYLHGLYVGDGWYQDGLDGRFDYYNSFILHPDLLAWARWEGESDPDRAAKIAARAAAFAHHFPYFFDARGASVFFGRSLAYRSALTAGLQAAEIEGVSPLPSGQARRLVSGNLAMFVGEDLEGSDAMFNGMDAIRSGYFADNPGMLEPYQREGSQYFFTRVFAALRLGEDHPYWSSVEQPIPADEGAFVHGIVAPGFVLNHDPERELVLMFSVRADKPGADYFDKYRRLQYSSASYFQRAFEAPFEYDALVTASPSEQFRSVRGEPFAGEVGPGFAYLRYTTTPESQIWSQAHAFGVASLWIRGGILRVACLDASFDESTRLYEGGFALDAARATVQTLDWAEPALFVHTPELSTLLAGTFGYPEIGMDFGVADSPRYNAIYPRGTHPALRGSMANSAAPVCTGSFQVLSRSSFAPTPFEHVVSSVGGPADTRQRSLLLDDGTWVWMNLELEPVVVDLELGPLQFSGPLRVAVSSADGSSWMAVGASEVRRIGEVDPLVSMDAKARLQSSAASWSEAADTGVLEVELGGPATLQLPPAWADATVLRVGLGGSVLTLADTPVDGVYVVDPAGFAAAASELRLETARFEFVAN